MRQDAIEQFEIKPAKGLTEGVTLSEEKTNVEVLFFCKEHKECRLLVYREPATFEKDKNVSENRSRSSGFVRRASLRRRDC